MKKKLNVKNYIAIADWMLELGLNTRELLAYAIIYSFSQKPGSCYYGSFEYMANWLGMDSSCNVNRYLRSLVDKKLVIKKEIRTRKNQKACIYRTNINRGPVVNNPDIDYIIIQPWMLQQLHLNGKDLLLYALVHGYSRKESGNVCRYNKEYFARWLQCRKDHVDRQANQAIKNNLISQIRPGEYIAIVPEHISVSLQDSSAEDFGDIEDMDIDNEFTQSESTPVKSVTQSESGLTQSESTPSPKVKDNNLSFYTLVNNLGSNNNTSSNFSTVVYLSMEDLSVVVNEDIPLSDFCSETEKTIFVYKQSHDFELYRKYEKKNPYLAKMMRLTALADFRIMLARWPDLSPVSKAETLFLETVCNPRFKQKQEEIYHLGKEKINELFDIAMKICDPDDSLNVSNRKAYLIRTLEIMLEEV